jgi:hypothetical protein
MILEVKAVSLNTPGTFYSSSQMFTSYCKKEGAANLWNQDLHLHPILA